MAASNKTAVNPVNGKEIGATTTSAQDESEPVTTTTTALRETQSKVVTCRVEDGLPVAQVKVTNTSHTAGVFLVKVKFLDGNSVLGSGLEYTEPLEPGQDNTVEMGNMQGDHPAVTNCKVVSVKRTEPPGD